MSTATYVYRRESTLTATGLDLQTSGGPAAHPRFFTGSVTQPQSVAIGLLAVAEVARTRYYQQPLPGSRDPVVTAGDDRLRFESFSGCCGVHARLDVLPAGLDGDLHQHGTTNVDVGTTLRQSLARVGATGVLGLSVGPEDLAVTTADGAVVERKVPLPTRWLRGFAETAVLTRDLAPRMELGPAAARAFLQRINTADRTVLWLVPTPSGARMTSRPAPGAVCLAGAGRLTALRAFARRADRLTVYGPAATVTSAALTSVWEVTAGPVRLTLTLSPEPSRGFSGEGAVLEYLIGDDVADDADLVSSMLAWEPTIDLAALASGTGLPPGRVQNALVLLGMSGRVGTDLAERGWFHRSLPFDVAAAAALNPRLTGAKALVAAGGVRSIGDGWEVTSGDQVYRVRRSADRTLCSCPWWIQYAGERGPCKHALAVVISLDAARSEP